MKRFIIFLLLVLLTIQNLLAQPAVTDQIGTIKSDKKYEFTIERNIASSNELSPFFEVKVKTDIVILTTTNTSIKSTPILFMLKPGSAPPFSIFYSQTSEFKMTIEPGQYQVACSSNSYPVTVKMVISFNPLEKEVQSFGDLIINQNSNYILTALPTIEENVISYDPGKELINITYFDGLGRFVESIQSGITPLKSDLVSYQEYDELGRESNNWLPVSIAANKGDFVELSKIKTSANSIYQGDSSPYAKILYEASPLKRPVEKYGPGADWQSTINKKAIRTGFLTNKTKTGIIGVLADSLICGFYTSSDIKNIISISKSKNYDAGDLFITRLKDEDNNISYEFKNKLDQIVLTRMINNNEMLDTYFIYDCFGNLRVVLPPKASDAIAANGTWTDTNTDLSQLAYFYKYDNRDRCIAKKIPGCDWMLFVYDKADQLIFKQDGEQRLKNEWTFSIPDELGRIVLTGICKSVRLAGSTTDSPLKSGLFDDKLLTAEYTSPNTYNGYILKGKDKDNKDLSVVLVTPFVLTASYYDNYNFLSLSGFSTLTYNAAKESEGYGKRYNENKGYEAKGLLTGTATAQLGGTTTMLNSVMYYDYRKRLIQAKSTNHLVGIEEEYIAYNFTSQPIKKQHVHTATGKITQTEYYTYEYDHAGRLKKTKHQLKEGTAAAKPEVILAENSYDELGRLITSKKAGQANLETTYKYNVRSWTKSISSPLFSQTLYYNESYGGSKAQYNGNISAMNWNVWDETKKTWEKNRGYTFSYDNLSRLTAANYLENGVVPINTANPTAAPSYKTAYTYDKHGNMKTLVRRGNTNIGIYGTIDSLSMEYTGNQLKYVKDDIKTPIYSLSSDFKDNTLHKDIEYTYNKNGAMSKDWNKGIDAITYNSLNLPQVMVINSSVAKAKNYYTYSASGVKLRSEQRYDHDLQQIPLQNTNPTNDGLKDYKITDYVGNIIYETEKVGTTAATNKTRILIDGGYIENGIYYFYLTDHLGNNRVVAKADGTVVQRNHYYPFGMTFAESTNEKAQPYKYNGKELDQMHGLNWSDYEARWKAEWYLPTVDPLAEKYYNISPYAYCLNNPVKYIDPDGKQVGFPLFLAGSNPVVPLGRTATMLSTTDKVVRAMPKEEHHLMPRSLKGNDVVKSARKGGFKMEGKENKLQVDKFNRATGEGQHAKHQNYTQQIKDQLKSFEKENPNYSPEQAAEAVRNIISNVKEIIKNNPDTKINDIKLNETVIPTDNIKVQQPKITSPMDDARKAENAKFNGLRQQGLAI